MNKRRLVGDLKVPNAAVSLQVQNVWTDLTFENNFKKWSLCSVNYLSTQVDYASVWIIEWQQNPITGVHLLDTYGLIHVVLQTQNYIFNFYWYALGLYQLKMGEKNRPCALLGNVTWYSSPSAGKEVHSRNFGMIGKNRKCSML